MKILTCTDGSIYATSVYQHTAWLASKFDEAVSVEVLHLLEPLSHKATDDDRTGRLKLGSRRNLLEKMIAGEQANAQLAREEGETILEEAQAMLEKLGVSKVSTTQLHGKLTDTIENLESAANFIVLGKRGKDADFQTEHLGSNLERVIRSVDQPVLVASREYKQPKQVAIAYDGSESVRKALDFLATMPLLTDLSCTLLHVGDSDSAASSDLYSAEKQLRDAGITTKAKLLHGDVDGIIAEYVEKENIDLLVMGAYGHSPLRQLILGSTTTALIRAVHRPVLLFR